MPSPVVSPYGRISLPPLRSGVPLRPLWSVFPPRRLAALTGQGILLVGMMTEAVVTPWLSDRDLALQNVRYVLNAVGNLQEDFKPAHGGFIHQRAEQVLGESIELLEKILDHDRGLLDAIADGTFGLMKRPADAGRGLDGVARKAAGYFNPATEILEGGR
jgi:beta-lysine 5,6-aminomutase alpha subunit